MRKRVEESKKHLLDVENVYLKTPDPARWKHKQKDGDLLKLDPQSEQFLAKLPPKN